MLFINSDQKLGKAGTGLPSSLFQAAVDNISKDYLITKLKNSMDLLLLFLGFGM